MKNDNRKIYIVSFVILVISTTFLLYLLLSGKEKQNELVINEGRGVEKSAFMVLDTDKSVYSMGDSVYLYASAVDEVGNTLCDCDLDIRIKDPDGGEIILNTSGGDISKSTACSEDGGKTNDPDYQSYFDSEKEGVYTIKITDLNSNLTAQKNIEVKENVDIAVARYGTTRVNPSESERYHMIIKINAKGGFKGRVIDYFPSSFDIVWRGEAVVDYPAEAPQGTISWDVDLKAGDIEEFKYDYKVAEPGPNTFSMGKINVMGNNSEVVFEEGNSWNLVVGMEMD